MVPVREHVTGFWERLVEGNSCYKKPHLYVNYCHIIRSISFVFVPTNSAGRNLAEVSNPTDLSSFPHHISLGNIFICCENEVVKHPGGAGFHPDYRL
jgi:hypothetical protein